MDAPKLSDPAPASSGKINGEEPDHRTLLCKVNCRMAQGVFDLTPSELRREAAVPASSRHFYRFGGGGQFGLAWEVARMVRR